MAAKSLLRLERQFDHLERGIPRWASRPIHWLRRPGVMWIRVPLGLLLIAGGILSFLPILGMWMLPLGFLLLAIDVPFLRTPVVLSSILLQRRFTLMRRALRDRKNRKAAH